MLSYRQQMTYGPSRFHALFLSSYSLSPMDDITNILRVFASGNTTLFFISFLPRSLRSLCAVELLGLWLRKPSFFSDSHTVFPLFSLESDCHLGLLTIKVSETMGILDFCSIRCSQVPPLNATYNKTRKSLGLQMTKSPIIECEQW